MEETLIVEKRHPFTPIKTVGNSDAAIVLKSDDSQSDMQVDEPIKPVLAIPMMIKKAIIEIKEITSIPKKTIPMQIEKPVEVEKPLEPEVTHEEEPESLMIPQSNFEESQTFENPQESAQLERTEDTKL